ncbi:MAG TPA: OmpH family outer membrane protein [Deltaproteobacteria bacterium]|nr:OmpH family outer membrane protein [Deltaproteobacteria bacterium]HOM29296.1 OmpH family outer membrane protein [Deltaproteobacteria bacterium]HPP81646.1 OmpH family outer membrane protein [Deltaproteobacteria bacterium]
MKRHVTWVCILLTVLFVSCLPAGSRAEELKIACIDSRRVITESMVGKDAYEKLKKLSEQKESELKKQEAKIKSLSDEIQAKSATMSASAKEDLQQRYEKEVKEYNRSYKDAQDDLRNTEMNLLKPWTKELEAIIKDYGEKNKIDLILDKTNPAVIYGSKKVDITDAIISLFDKRYQEKSSQQKQKKE